MLGWELPPSVSGGLGTACQGILSGLGDCGVDVIFAAPRVRRKPRRALGSRRRMPRATSREALSGIARHFQRVFAGSPLAPYGDYSPGMPEGERDLYGPELRGHVRRFTRELESLASGLEYDIVHAHDWMTFQAAQRVSAAAGVPWICHVHSCESDRAGARPDAGIEAIERRGCASADRVVAVSRYAAGRLSEAYGVETDRVRVVHGAVEAPPVQGRAPENERGRPSSVLFLGRITGQKDPRTFLAAAARVACVEPDARFVMAGAGDLLPEMVASARALGLGGRVEFPGFLEGRARERAFAAADVFVMPSRSEPFGLAALEAAARGVPVVVSRASGVRERLSSCLVAEPGDAEGFAGRVLDLLRDSSLRHRLARDGRREALRQRWSDRGRELLSLYRELCA